MLAIIRPLWAYRGFILGSVKREFQSKYQNSVLGAAWNVLNPLAMIIVYTLIFSQIMRAKLPGVDSVFGYSIYLCAGIITWGMFAEIISRGQNVFLENANLLKKLSFPRLCLPVTVVANAGLNFSIIFGLFTVFLLLSGSFPGLPFIAVFPLLALLVLFAIGLGITVGVLNVFFRDVGQFFGIFLTFWFWLTPIVYPVTILPEKLQHYMNFNPMTRLMNAFQVVLVNGQWPNWFSLWPVVVLALLLCLFGFSLYRRHAGEMVDEL
jgi:lipopolysaccharide transport system permease protein